ncbi:DMT family transporter [Sporolactobacillus shoreae]|uniref:DMT family transporter n=1 Tax=Sporolactobacillus shoreae TaxID=1465501 RepID=A0A4Z0GSP2_9BACL|nr:DMT family transporter [Sporolactobacillus shoreae]TGB00414.1 DMT family transporter [Sporolactobacillus shoreae]
MTLRRALTADTALLGITFVWGTTFIIVQNVLDKLTPMTFNAWRFLIAALFLAIWKLLFKKNSEKSRQHLVRLIGSGTLLGFFLFIGYACQTIGLLYTSASNAAFITGLSVVLVPILSALLLRKMPPAAAIAGILFAVVGLFFLTTRGQLSLNRGDLIVLICAAAFALHIVFTAKVTDQYNSLSLTIVQLTVVALLSLVFGFSTEGLRIADFQTLLEPDVAGVILFMALFATAFAFLLQTLLQKETPATHVGIIYIMEPVFAAWTSVLFQHVHLGTAELAGCGFILIGMLLAEWPDGRKSLSH